MLLLLLPLLLMLLLLLLHMLLLLAPHHRLVFSRVAVFYVSLAEGTVKRGDMACDTAPDDESR